MRRITPLIGAGALALVLVLPACGDDDSTTSATTTGGTTATTSASATTSGSSSGAKVGAEPYVEKVCTALGDFTSSVSDIQGEIQSAVGNVSDLQQGKQAVTDAFQSFADEASQLADEVQAAGVPDVANGEQIASDLKSSFTALKDAISKLVADSKELPTDNPAVFTAAITKLTTGFTSALSDIDAQSVTSSPELSAAAAKVDACKNVS
jgi:hypothetical protein